MAGDAPTRALRAGSPEILLEGLRDEVAGGDRGDARDLMLALAPYHDCARRLGLDVPALFAEAARSAPEAARDTIVEFGRRTDITPQGFAYVVEETPEGPRYKYEMPPIPSVDETREMLRRMGMDV